MKLFLICFSVLSMGLFSVSNADQGLKSENIEAIDGHVFTLQEDGTLFMHGTAVLSDADFDVIQEAFAGAGLCSTIANGNFCDYQLTDFSKLEMNQQAEMSAIIEKYNSKF